MRARLALAALAVGLAGAAAPRAADEIGPGAYCPLPEAGEKPRCLEPAQAEYAGFFRALDAGSVDEAEAARLERDLEAQHSYLALSSVSYGYYRLSQRLAASETQDPAIVARLDRWNALLSRAYAGSEQDARYRDAVRRAALDLARHASLELRCVDARGEATDCDSPEAVLRGIRQADREAGIEGALRRLLERILGAEAS